MAETKQRAPQVEIDVPLRLQMILRCKTRTEVEGALQEVKRLYQARLLSDDDMRNLTTAVKQECIRRRLRNRYVN